MAKKRSVKKVVVEEEGECGLYENHCCKVFLVKLASMAFILFLITVWPWLNRVLLSVHWGIYLGIALLLTACAMVKCCNHHKKH